MAFYRFRGGPPEPPIGEASHCMRIAAGGQEQKENKAIITVLIHTDIWFTSSNKRACEG
jgi:hypothetical protein